MRFSLLASMGWLHKRKGRLLLLCICTVVLLFSGYYSVVAYRALEPNQSVAYVSLGLLVVLFIGVIRFIFRRSDHDMRDDLMRNLLGVFGFTVLAGVLVVASSSVNRTLNESMFGTLPIARTYEETVLPSDPGGQAWTRTVSAYYLEGTITRVHTDDGKEITRPSDVYVDVDPFFRGKQEIGRVYLVMPSGMVEAQYPASGRRVRLEIVGMDAAYAKHYSLALPPQNVVAIT